MMTISASELLLYQRAIRHLIRVIASAALLTSLPFKAAKAYQVGGSWGEGRLPIRFE